MGRNRSKSILFISVLAAIMAFIWASVTAYSVLRKSTIAPDLRKAMEPINPNLDQTLFTKLQQRNK